MVEVAISHAPELQAFEPDLSELEPAIHPLERRFEHLRNYAGLAWAMSRKNFQIRYKRAVLGIMWAVLQPAFQAAVLSFVFLKIFRIHSVPHYPLYVLSGMLPWSFFAASALVATTAVVDNAALVRKIALPLTVFPVSAVGGTAIAFSASLSVLIVTTIFFGTVGWGVLLLPAALLLEVAAIIGVALITGGFYVAFRDVRYAVESSLVLGVYATPILYPLSRVPHELQWAFRLNPMTGVLSMTRAAALDYSVDVASVLTAIGVTTVLLAVGVVLFRHRSGEFADLL